MDAQQRRRVDDSSSARRAGQERGVEEEKGWTAGAEVNWTVVERGACGLVFLLARHNPTQQHSIRVFAAVVATSMCQGPPCPA